MHKKDCTILKHFPVSCQLATNRQIAIEQQRTVMLCDLVRFPHDRLTQGPSVRQCPGQRVLYAEEHVVPVVMAVLVLRTRLAEVVIGPTHKADHSFI